MTELNTDILEFKNFAIFYENLYKRLFELINHLIDDNQLNINSTRDKMNDFLDSYSYYIISKKIIEREDLNKEDIKEKDSVILEKLNQFESFSESLNKYSTIEYNKIRFELIKNDYDLSKLSFNNYDLLMKEYYEFFNDVIIILSQFIEIASLNGFLPILKNNNSLKTIGFANYKAFFMELENLKLKMSGITTTIKLNNVFKCRRCVYSVLIIFSPYFKRQKIFNKLSKGLDFNFLNDQEIMKDFKKSYDYDDFLNLPKELKEKLENKILIPIKTNVRLIKRYMSFEFGEIDMSPKLKKKYNYDPTWT